MVWTSRCRTQASERPRRMIFPISRSFMPRVMTGMSVVSTPCFSRSSRARILVERSFARQAEEVEEVRVHRRLAAREVDEVELAAMVGDEVREDGLELLHAHVER